MKTTLPRIWRSEVTTAMLALGASHCGSGSMDPKEDPEDYVFDSAETPPRMVMPIAPAEAEVVIEELLELYRPYVTEDHDSQLVVKYLWDKAVGALVRIEDART